MKIIVESAVKSAKEIPARIVIETFPSNNTIRDFHATIQISDARIACYDHESDAVKKVGPRGGLLISEVSKIAGITEVRLTKYSMRIKIDLAFKWEEVEEKVIAVIKEAAFGFQNEVAVSYKPL